MHYTVYGLITLLLSASSFIWAFRLHGKKEPHAVLLLIIGGLILRIFAASDPFLHEWDERCHALVAKHLSENWLKPVLYKTPVLEYDYTNWSANHIWLHKQPMALWLMATCIKLFGATIFSIRLPSVLLSAISVKLVYDTGKYLTDARTAFIAAFLFSIHGLIIELAGGRVASDHIDVIFLFFILLSFTLLVKNITSGKILYLLAAGIFIGCAVLTKWLTAFIVIPLYVILAFEKQKPVYIFRNVALLLLISAIVYMPWQLYIMKQYPLEAAWEYNYNSRHLFEAVEMHSGNFFYHFDKLRMNYGEIVYIPCAWVTYICIKKKNDYRLWCIILWFWLVYLFFSISKTKMPAYTLIASPAVFLMTAYTFNYIMTYKDHIRYKRILAILAWLLLLLPVRYAIERVKPFTKPSIPQWMEVVHELEKTNMGDRVIIFNASNPLEIMFHTPYIAYQQIPSPKVINDLKTAGYKVIVWQ